MTTAYRYAHFWAVALTVLAGTLLGGPLIVAGQSLRVLLAQRLLLERLNQHVARSGDQ
jgi:hypothetical protein